MKSAKQENRNTHKNKKDNLESLPFSRMKTTGHEAGKTKLRLPSWGILVTFMGLVFDKGSMRVSGVI